MTESDLIDTLPEKHRGSKPLQVTLFVFACFGFLFKGYLAIQNYAKFIQLARMSRGSFAYMVVPGTVSFLKLFSLGLFIHSILLFIGSLYLLRRKRSGIWMYTVAQMFFIIVVLYLWIYNGNHQSFSNYIEFWVSFIALMLMGLFFTLNLSNRKYWSIPKNPLQ